MARRVQGEGTINRRKDGRYEAKLRVGTRAGKPIRKSFYGATRQEVAEQLRAYTNRHRTVFHTDFTLAEYAEQWLADSDWRPNTYRLRAGAMKRHILPYALIQRPEAVATLGAIYVEWTRIESFLSIMLAMLMFGENFSTGNEIIVIEVMEHCTTINDKIACVLAAARQRLHKRPKLLESFEAQLKTLEGSARMRNNLVHGRWSLGPEPDKIAHKRRASDRTTTIHTPAGLGEILYDLERKADELPKLFFDKVIPASEKVLGHRVSYLTALQNRKNGV